MTSLPSPPWVMGRLRPWVQLVMLAMTVYGGWLTGPYVADKLSTALPALSCAYDQQNGGYCALIPLQHQLHHQLGEAIARSGTVAFGAVRPVIITLLTFWALLIILNKAFCSWVCPLGTVQELLGRAGRRIGLEPVRIPPAGLRLVRPVKWIALLLLVLVLPLATGLGLAPNVFGDGWCRICPSRIVTTLMTGNLEQLALNTATSLEMGLGLVGNLLAGFLLVAAMAVRQPFCRICPMLALQALFRRLAPLQLFKQRHPRCGHCRSCTTACPMDIPEIVTADGSVVFHDDCTLCGRCIDYCPQERVLSMRLGRWSWYRSGLARFRASTSAESADGFPRGRAAFRRTGAFDG